MDPIVPGIYRHYKGKDYEVIGVAIHSETEEAFVVYRALYGEFMLTIRPKTLFLEEVEKGPYKGPRFTLIKPF